MKALFRTALGLVYIAALLFSLIVLIKPGASLFYTKSPAAAQTLVREGNAFVYKFETNTKVYNPDSLLVLEDHKVLQKSVPGFTTTEGDGTFALKDIRENEILILVNPTHPSNPRSDEPGYSLYIKPYLFSRVWGNVGFLILLLGLVHAVAPILADPQKRRMIFAPPAATVMFWASLFDRPRQKAAGGSARSSVIPRNWFWKQAAIHTILAAYFYVLMEWVFFATKPSFMDFLNLGEKVKVLLLTGFEAALISLLVLMLVFLLEFPLSRVLPGFHKYARHLPAAFLAACLCLILIDNFTYTIIKFGIVNAETFARILYELGFVGSFLYFLHYASKKITPVESGKIERVKTVGTMILFSVSLVLAGFSFRPVNNTNAQAVNISSASEKPNIILFGSDGVNAASMSVYGYERDTTPFIRELAKTSLKSENNFNNADHSLGSDTSTLTGKLPLATRVYNGTSILKGADMYLHLPGMLKQNGYRTVQLGVPGIIDANTQNFMDAFDSVNCKQNTAESLSNTFLGYRFEAEFYLLFAIEGRIKDRLNHIFFIEDMVNPYKLVTEDDSYDFSDEQRIKCLQSYLKDAGRTGQPLFAHIHQMGTHGSRFNPRVPTFSKDKIQTDGWMTDFYDDSILDFDTQVHQLVQSLKDNGLYENSILILYTDHSQNYYTIHKIPLIMHFPNDQHAGTITENTQNLDIAPTILDFMGIPIPDWMGGSSLLAKLDPKRLIFASGAKKSEAQSFHPFALPDNDFNPQIHQLPVLSVIQCQKWYILDLQNMTVSEGEIAGYVQACPAEMLDNRDRILEKVGILLKQLGYDTSSN